MGGNKRKFQSKGKPVEMSLAQFQTETPSSLSVPRTEQLEKSIYQGFTILGSDSVPTQANIVKAEPVFVMEKNTTSDFQQPVKKSVVALATPPVQEETKQPPKTSKEDSDKDEWQEVVAEKKEKKDKIYNQAPSHNAKQATLK